MRNFLLLFMLLVSLSAQASNLITATITVTNAPSDGDTLVINGSTRTWKTVVGTASTQVLIDAAIGGNATNLYNQVATYTFTTLTLGHSGTNGITLRGVVGQTITVAITGTWGTYTLGTNVSTESKTVMMPASSYQTQSDATNIISQLALDLGTYSTNSLAAGSTFLANLVQTSGTQTAAGVKTFTGANVYSNATQVFSGGSITQATVKTLFMAYDNTVANGIQFFSSIPARVTSLAADANGYPTLYGTAVSAVPSTVLGGVTPPSGGTLLWRNAADYRYGQLQGAPSNAWLGTNTFTGPGITNSVIGASILTNVTGIYGTLGLLSSGTLDGSALTNVSVAGTIVSLTGGYLDGVGATNLVQTNSTFKSSSDFVGDIAFQRLNHTALANGANADVDFGTSSFIKIKAGPTAVFSIAGIANPRNGKRIIVYNNSGFAMTISNESGTEPTPANRILTLSGSDYATTGDGAVTLIYDSDASRWILIGKVD
jgi:hypothetical protein